MWKTIRLELAQTDGFPAGSVSRAYLIRLPLDEQGLLDGAAFQRHPYRAKVRRYWSTEPDQTGEILQADGQWALRCEGMRRILHLDGHPLIVDRELSIVDVDGTILPFKIASVG